LSQSALQIPGHFFPGRLPDLLTVEKAFVSNILVCFMMMWALGFSSPWLLFRQFASAHPQPWPL